MAVVIPKTIYNFNENSSTTIRDYSQNNEQGTGTNLTIQASTRNGYECAFNGTSSRLENTTYTYLSSVSGLTITMGIKLGAATGTDYIFNIAGIVDCIWDGTTLTGRLTTTSGTYSTTNDITAISTGTYYDITLRFNSSTNRWRMFVDETSQTSVATVGSTPVLSPDLDIGWDGSGNYGLFDLNEFKIIAETSSNEQLQAFINEQNGVKITTSKLHGYSVGDIIGSNINTDYSAYAIVTFVESTTIFRIQPLTDEIGSSSVFQRCGHLWDTTRQWIFIMDDTPQICFYNGVSKSSEVLSASKKVYCLNTDGIIKNSSTKTANYTVLDTDQRIYVDSSGGAFTITLESSPATDRELEIIDSVGSCGTNAVTVAGNGNNINGATPQNMNANYDSWHIVFNGTQWNLK